MCRAFLATLQLAADGEVEIVHPTVPGAGVGCGAKGIPVAPLTDAEATGAFFGSMGVKLLNPAPRAVFVGGGAGEAASAAADAAAEVEAGEQSVEKGAKVEDVKGAGGKEDVPPPSKRAKKGAAGVAPSRGRAKV